MEGSGSSLDTSDTIDPNHYVPSVYRKVLKGVVERIVSVNEIADNDAVISDNTKSENDKKDLLGYCESFVKWIRNIL